MSISCLQDMNFWNCRTFSYNIRISLFCRLMLFKLVKNIRRDFYAKVKCSLDGIVLNSDCLPGGLTPRKSSISTALRAKLAEKLKAAKVGGRGVI